MVDVRRVARTPAPALDSLEPARQACISFSEAQRGFVIGGALSRADRQRSIASPPREDFACVSASVLPKAQRERDGRYRRRTRSASRTDATGGISARR
jgi:hypothetical protein